MCGNGLIGLTQATLRHSAATPAKTLLAHLGLEIKAAAEVQDLYSRPIHQADVVELVTGEHRLPRVPRAEAA
jgi:hypothetical protein